MDIETVTQVINSLGFPIAMVIYFAWDRVNREKAQAEQMKAMTDALNNNTLAITELSERFKG